MGQPAAKQGDAITATHPHVVTVSGNPATFSFPFTGQLDGGLSENVNIEGKAAAMQGSTATNTPRHLPVPGPFSPEPSNQASISQGSTSVSINGKPAARTGDPATACDIPGAQVMAAGTVCIG